MEIPIHTVEEYKRISADVWNVFKKYYDGSINTDDFTMDIHAVEVKYKSNPRLYEFEQGLMRLYMAELKDHKLQQERRENEHD